MSFRGALVDVWKSQESYFTYVEDASPSPVDHNIHFRPGIGVDGGETFTPRALIYDLKGGFGSMKKINALYEMEQGEDAGIQQGLWYVGWRTGLPRRTCL